MYFDPLLVIERTYPVLRLLVSLMDGSICDICFLDMDQFGVLPWSPVCDLYDSLGCEKTVST
jgi:hypothetical protein